jgi:hypothetical protein
MPTSGGCPGGPGRGRSWSGRGPSLCSHRPGLLRSAYKRSWRLPSASREFRRSTLELRIDQDHAASQHVAVNAGFARPGRSPDSSLAPASRSRTAIRPELQPESQAARRADSQSPPGVVPGRNPLHHTGRCTSAGTKEQPASNQAREPGAANGGGTEESPGQDGCAARDLNPNPRIKSPLTLADGRYRGRRANNEQTRSRVILALIWRSAEGS